MADESAPKAVEGLMKIIHDACGILINPRKMKAEAKAEMEIEKQCILHKYEAFEMELLQRAKFRRENADLLRQYNLETTTTAAANMLPEIATPEKIDPNWIHYYAESCQDVGEDELKNLWSRLLVQESVSPGKYPKRTLDKLKALTVEDTVTVAFFLSHVLVYGDDYLYCIYQNGETEKDVFYYNKHPSFVVKKYLAEIGFIDSTPGGFQILNNDGTNLSYFGENFLIIPSSLDPVSRSIHDIVHLTDFGKDLCTIVEVEKNDGYKEEYLSHLKGRGFIVEQL